MNTIGLVVDEGADLTQELIKKHKIAVVPLKVIWPEEIEGLPGETIFHKMQEADKRGMKVFCKTSQPSPKDFLDIFKEELKKSDKIICFTVTSKLSGTYNSAVQAKDFLSPEEKKRVFVVDSLSALAGEGLLALKAVDLTKEGGEIEEIVKTLRSFPSKIHLYAFIRDPKWLEVSGRISPALANWMRRGAKMGVRPLIGIKKGLVKPIGIRLGAKDIPEALFKELEVKSRKVRKEGKRIRIAIIHCLDEKGTQKLREMIEKKLENTEIVFINLVDEVIGSIVGPGSLALGWCEI
jgi:DegV family protein with EDD domain